MALSKKITLTVVGHTIRLSSEIKFYQYDQLNLIFEINEYGIDVESDDDITKSIMPINPLDAVLFFETPAGIDTLFPAEIVDNTVVFHLDSVQTQHVGVSRMQIQLSDGDCCQVTLPEFEFEIRKPIYDTQTILRRILLADDDGNLIVDDDGVTFHVGNQIFSMPSDAVIEELDGFITKQIKDYDLDSDLTGDEDVLIQDNDGIVKRVKASNLINNLVDGGEVDVTFKTDMLTPIALGGIEEGEDLNNLSVQEVLTQLLYPYVAPSVSAYLVYSPSGTVFEKGVNVEITAFKGSFVKKSEPIQSIAFYDGANILSETSENLESNTIYTHNFDEPIIITSNLSNTRFRFGVVDETSKRVLANTSSINFYYPYYFGVIGDYVEDITGDLITEMTKKVEAKGNKTHSFTTFNECMIIAYPKTYGSLKKILDQNSFDVTATFTKSEVVVVGLDGTEQKYYVYRNNASTVSNFKMTFQY